MTQRTVTQTDLSLPCGCIVTVWPHGRGDSPGTEAAVTGTCKWKEALEGLTPGGSEFYASPQNCARFVRRMLNDRHGIIMRLQARVKALNAEAEVSKAHSGNVAATIRGWRSKENIWEGEGHDAAVLICDRVLQLLDAPSPEPRGADVVVKTIQEWLAEAEAKVSEYSTPMAQIKYGDRDAGLWAEGWRGTAVSYRKVLGLLEEKQK